MISKNIIKVNHGCSHLEHDDAKFRWMGNAFELIIDDTDIKQICLDIMSIYPDISYKTEQSDFINVPVGRSKIILNVENRKNVNLELKYFVPHERINNGDRRKLSYRLYGIDVIYNNKTQYYSAEDIFIMPNEDFNKYLANNTSINIHEYGDYGNFYLSPSNSVPSGKININNQVSYLSHRSGWKDVMVHLSNNFHNDQSGVYLYSFLEDVFSWRKKEYLEKRLLPLSHDWIGFVHNPPNMPCWFDTCSATWSIMFNDSLFKKSLHRCRGIYTLSNYAARYVRNECPNIKVESLYHPTETPNVVFDFNKFLDNKNKKLVSAGWWLRKLNQFYKIKSPFKKVRLIPKSNDSNKYSVEKLLSIEKCIYDIKITDEEINSVEPIERLCNDEYDVLLSQNIMYIDLYDSSANNAIIECIARMTPIVANKHEAVVEYLGKDYPLYFDNYDEIYDKLSDTNLLYNTHLYLKNLDVRRKIQFDYFIESFKNSEIYRSL